MTLAAEGAKVLSSDIKEETLEKAKAQVEAHAPSAEVYAVTADLTKPDDADKLLKATDEQSGAAVLTHVTGTRGIFSS